MGRQPVGLGHIVSEDCAVSVEYDCCECGRHIVAIVAEAPPVPPLCAECVFLPSWHEDPQLRAILDPEYQPHG